MTSRHVLVMAGNGGSGRRRRVRLRRHALAPRQLRAVPAPGRRNAAARSRRSRRRRRRWCGEAADQWTRNAAKAEVVRRLLGGRDAEAVDAVARAFADDIVRPAPAERGGRAGRLAPDAGSPPRDRVGVARALPAPGRRAAAVRRGARHRARGGGRRPAHRQPGRRQRARPREGPPARRVARGHDPRSCGPTATARATWSSGPRRPRRPARASCRAAGLIRGKVLETPPVP